MKNLFSLLLFLGAFLPASQAARFYVNAATGNDANTGTSWAQAFKTFQKAIETANNSDEIWLTGGTYRASKDFSGNSYPNTLKRFESFYINKAFQIYGRFAGTEATAAQRNPNNPPTVLSGDIDGDDLASPAQSESDIQGENGYKVIYMTNLPANGTIRLDDIVVSGGVGDGGMLISDGGPNVTITHCRFTGNFGNQGNNVAIGGLQIYASVAGGCKPKIDNCTFDYNTNQSGPGGCHVWAANGPINATFTNCHFENNVGSYGGGLAVFSANSAAIVSVSTSVIANNTATGVGGGSGGGIFCYNSTLTCTNCNINDNLAYNGGAASIVDNSQSVLFNQCNIFTNRADNSGGGIYMENANVTLEGGQLYQNLAYDGEGGGVAIEPSTFSNSPQFSCTGTIFLGNRTFTAGGAICDRDPNTTLQITKTDFRGNYSHDGGAVYMAFESDCNVNTVIDESLFRGNEAAFGSGAAFYLKQAPGTSHPTGLQVRFTTLYNNLCNINGNQVYTDNMTFDGIALISRIVSASSGVGEFYAVNGGVTHILQSMVQSADCDEAGITSCGDGNVFGKDPLFVNAANDNFQLQMCSPAVNTAGYSGFTGTDFAGNPRPFNDGDGNLDMGAYEYQGTPPNSFYRDVDGDGYGQTLNKIRACNAPVGYAPLPGDCNDSNNTINPGAPEICDNYDNNCNNLVDAQDPGLIDETPPTFMNVPTDLQLTCADQVPAPANVLATDNCTANPVLIFKEVSTRSTNSSDCAYYTYTITRTWTATDLKNNSASTVQVITVKDTQSPVFTSVSPNVTVGCDQIIPGYVPPSATDNCSTVSMTLQTTSDRSNNPNDCSYYTYVITRTWTAQDRCGNTATAQQTVTVQDTKAPFVSIPPAQQVMVECDQAIPQITFLASQDCDANPILTVTEESVEFDADAYDHVFQRITRHITLTDHCGNATTFTQVLKVRDNLPPQITNCPDDIVVTGDQNGALVNFPAANVKDNCSDFTVYYMPYEPGSQFPLGVTQVYIDVFDRGANSTECSFKVTVKDDFRVHCQEPIFATVLAGTSPDNNAVRWNPPFAEACASCDAQQNDPQFQQRFKPLGNLHGHRYYLSNAKLPAAAAASVCAQYGGYLATPNSSVENRMLTNELAGQAVLIGLNDVATEGTFVWADGQALGFQHWAAGQPSSVLATAAGLDYVSMAANGQWQNVGTDSMQFILEIPCYDVRTIATNMPTTGLAPVGSYEVKYRIQDFCGRTDECVQSVFVARDRKAYCQPNLYPDVMDRDTSLWIQQVKIGTFTQKSGNNYGSARFVSNPNVSLTTGQTVPMTITLGNNTGNPKAYVHVWFDANADRDFYDAGEVLLDTFVTTNQISFTALIPANAATGDARQRMRIAVSRYYAPEACGDYVTGETEDYRVSVKATNTINFKSEPVADRTTESASALLFPNPANTEAFLNLSEYEGATCTVRLVDMQGRMVQSFTVENTDDALIRLDLGGLVSGLYLVQTQAEGHSLRTDKLIIADEK